MVYEDIFDAKNACEHLSGFNVCGRYLVVLYYQVSKTCITYILISQLPTLTYSTFYEHRLENDMERAKFCILYIVIYITEVY